MSFTTLKMLRTYDDKNTPDRVRSHYKMMRQYQTVNFVDHMHKKYLKFEKPMHIWQALKSLNDWVDTSDPDMSLPNIQHCFQAAEGARSAGRDDWVQLIALIHDLGKVLYLKGSDSEGTGQKNQFATVGDTFVVGCKLPDNLVYPEYNCLNPDMKDSRYNGEIGMYTPGCGLDNLTLSFGHDEYLYQVLKNHRGCIIPKEGLNMIRYHSFYPWHSPGANESPYDVFMSRDDYSMRTSVLEFNEYDLYTKNNTTIYDVKEMKKIYMPILKKYLGSTTVYF